MGGPALPALGHALAGSIGSAISNVAVFPLDLIITRLQVQRQLRKDASAPHDGEYKGVQDAIHKIYNQEGGIGAFYTGMVQDTGKSMMDAFLFFLAYNFVRQQRLQQRGGRSKSLPALDELNVGFIAGAFSKFLTTPIANIVTRKQTAAMLAARSPKASRLREPTVREIADEIYKEKGLQGFWSGYSASLILTLNPSLTFLLYQSFKRIAVPRSRRDDPGATVTFFLAAISKAIASTITYPFSLAKARAQISSRTIDDNDDEVKEGLEKAGGGEVGGNEPSRRAARSTVFSTVAHIAQTEGIGALYEGLPGEVLKGFFSNGTTMIVKESVHKFIIQAYYLILKALRKYPSPEQLAQQIRDHARATAADLAETTKMASTTARENAYDLVERGQEVLHATKDQAADALKTGRQHAQDSIDSTRTQARSLQANATANAQTLAQKGNDQAAAALGTAKSGLVAARDKTGALAASVAEQAEKAGRESAEYVGRTTEEAGRAMRPANKGDR